MHRTKYYLTSLFALLLVQACGSETPVEEPEPEPEVPECTYDMACDSGKCLDTGKCAPFVTIGESCGAEAVCKEPYICKDGVCADDPTYGLKLCTSDSACHDSHKCLPSGYCAVNAELGDSCDAYRICVGDLECREGRCARKACETEADCPENTVCELNQCIELTVLEAGKDCDPGSRTAVCAEGLDCVGNVCVESAEATGCKTDDDCADEKQHKQCLSSGVCGTIVKLGEFCDRRFVCEEGLDCNIFCQNTRQENESCDPEGYQMCAEDLLCVDGSCRKYEYQLGLGADCNDEYQFCSDKYECLRGKCSQYVGQNETCGEDKFQFCRSGFDCISSMCTQVSVECAQTSDCQEKDSFCCIDESCGPQKNKCVPYNDEITHDEQCRLDTKPGIFEAQIQCRWQPTGMEVGSKNVELPPLVGHFGNKQGLKTVVAVWSYDPTVLRFINPETCETLESLKYSMNDRWYNSLAAADLDGDGLLELIAVDSKKRPVAFKYNASLKKHEVWWNADLEDAGSILSIYDINGDGKPEVVLGEAVIDATTGETIYAGANKYDYQTSAIGNFDRNAEGMATLAISNHVYKWDDENKTWKQIAEFPTGTAKQYYHLAYADFGTSADSSSRFDFTKLDGTPEIVATGDSKLFILELVPKTGAPGKYKANKIMEVSGFEVGGPITIGDFNNDGLPEIGMASKGQFGVYDPKCKGYEEGKCADKNILWERWSQDASSGTTGSSLFDFDGDGQAEAVYADECFTRVYEGKTGRILFSAKRSSDTSIEGPVVSDIDGDGSAEILMGSDVPMDCYDDTNKLVSGGVDPIHEGIRCIDDEDCPSGKNCNQEIGLCTCTTDDECNSQYIKGKLVTQYACADPIHPEVGLMRNSDNGASRSMVKAIGTRPDGWKSGDYKVCRATRKTSDIGIGDLMIFKDRLDRWVSSRPLWNQHAYNIINIEDNGKIPTTEQWLKNWLEKNYKLTILDSDAPRMVHNNYRMNRQGEFGAGLSPDITGRFISGSICGTTDDGRRVISGKLCNRGTKPVSMNLPASFFFYDENAADHRGEKICTSYTNANVGVGECAQVGCEVSEAQLKSFEGRKVIMVSNLDEHGFPSTIECNSENNIDTITIDKCEKEPIIIVN